MQRFLAVGDEFGMVMEYLLDLLPCMVDLRPERVDPQLPEEVYDGLPLEIHIRVPHELLELSGGMCQVVVLEKLDTKTPKKFQLRVGDVHVLGVFTWVMSLQSEYVDGGSAND